MKNKILAILLCVVMVVALLPLSASATSTYTVSDDFNYADATALAEVWKSEQANYKTSTTDIAVTAVASIDEKEGRSVMLSPQGKNRQSHYVTPISWPTDKLQKFTTVFYYDKENALAASNNPSIYLMRINGYRGLSLIMSHDEDGINLQWYEYYEKSAGVCDVKSGKTIGDIALNTWLTLTATYDYSVEGKATVSAMVSDGTNLVDLGSYTIIFAANETFTSGYGSYAVSKGNHAKVYFDSTTFEFEGEGQPETPDEPEVPDVPTVEGATIKKSGTQDLQFGYTTGKVDESNPIVEYGMLVTLKGYGIEDLTLNNTADIEDNKIKTASSGEVLITAPVNFTASIGEIPEDLYTYTYSTRTYVKYQDGSIVYSEIIDRSVSSVAKSIGKWVLDNESSIAGLTGDITALVNADGTLTEAAKENNGAAILAYLTDNADAITAALKDE